MSDGSIERKKVRLVARGFSQVEGIDFEETCSSVIKFPIIRIIITLAIHQGWDLQQLDVNNAFLNIECKESVYTRFVSSTNHCMDFINHRGHGMRSYIIFLILWDLELQARIHHYFAFKIEVVACSC